MEGEDRGAQQHAGDPGGGVRDQDEGAREREQARSAALHAATANPSIAYAAAETSATVQTMAKTKSVTAVPSTRISAE